MASFYPLKSRRIIPAGCDEPTAIMKIKPKARHHAGGHTKYLVLLQGRGSCIQYLHDTAIRQA